MCICLYVDTYDKKTKRPKAIIFSPLAKDEWNQVCEEYKRSCTTNYANHLQTRLIARLEMAGHVWVGLWGEGERENQITKLSKAIFSHISFVNDKMLMKINFCFDSTILFNLGVGRSITYQSKYESQWKSEFKNHEAVN